MRDERNENGVEREGGEVAARRPYSAPRVEEDLALESQSLACAGGFPNNKTPVAGCNAQLVS